MSVKRLTVSEGRGDALVRHGARAAAAPSADPLHARVVATMRDYLEANHARVVTLAELARLTGFSPFHVSRIFRAAVGVAPYAYLSLVRVRRARELLANGCPLSTVTYETGFFDQSHFTRSFKRVVGVPPGQYARDVRRSGGVAPRAGHFADRPVAGLASIVRPCGITANDRPDAAHETPMRQVGGTR